MERFSRAVSALASIGDKLSWLAVAGMMALVVFNCISRRFGYPVYGTYDYVGFLLIVVLVPALANCASHKAHIYLSMLTDHFPQIVQSVLDIVISVINCLFMFTIVWALVDRALRTYESGLTGMTSPIPVYPFIILEALFVLLLGLVYVSDAFSVLRKIRRAD